MFKRIVFFLIACSPLTPGIRLPENPFKSVSAQKVVINVTPAMTAADLFAQIIDGEKVLKLPDTPHFSHYFRGNMPQEYSAMFNDKLTLAAFMRFIENGHTLFENNTAATTYRQSLKKAVIEHMEFKRSPTDNNKQALVDAEQKVLDLLAEIKLDNPAITQKLVKMLSTPDWWGNSLKRAIASVLLPFRTAITENTEGKKIIRFNSWEQAIGVSILKWLVVTGVLYQSFFTDYVCPVCDNAHFPYVLPGMMAALLTSFIATDINLAPEPYPIIVEFNHQLTTQ